MSFMLSLLFTAIFTTSVADSVFKYSMEGDFNVAGVNDRRFFFYDHIYKSPTKLNTKIKDLKNKKMLFGKITVYYPEKGGDYPLIVLSHGWGDNKAAHAAMARHLSSYGFVTVVFSSKKRKKPEDWMPVISEVFRLVIEESKKNGSPLLGKIDFDRLGLLGHSMGGAASLHYANCVSNNISSVIALNPYNGGKGIVSKVGGNNDVLGDILKSHSSDTLIITGTKDVISLPKKTFEFFMGIENSKKTVFLTFKNHKHNYSVEGMGNFNAGYYNSSAHKIYRMLITAWFLHTLKPKYYHSVLAEKIFDFSSFEFNNYIKPLLEGLDDKECPAFIRK